MTSFQLNRKITIFGSKQEIDEAAEALKGLPDMSEGKARLEIQRIIDEKGLKASILYDGNTVWNKTRLLKDFKKVLKAGVLGHASYRSVGSMIRLPVAEGCPVLTKYLYEFLSLDCGSIAHYNIYGWIAEYPTVKDLRQFFIKNEYGQRVREGIPDWHTDALVIVEEMERLLKI